MSLGIENRNDFGRALKMFPWTQQTFGRRLVSVGDLLKLNSAVGVSKALVCSSDAASNFEAFISRSGTSACTVYSNVAIQDDNLR